MRDMVVYCDAFGCDEKQVSTDDDPNPLRWPTATLDVAFPTMNDPTDPDEGWHMCPEVRLVDACCVEHLRAAMAEAMAEMTDEPSIP